MYSEFALNNCNFLQKYDHKSYKEIIFEKGSIAVNIDFLY